jgi:hypothetical protein
MSFEISFAFSFLEYRLWIKSINIFIPFIVSVDILSLFIFIYGSTNERFSSVQNSKLVIKIFPLSLNFFNTFVSDEIFQNNPIKALVKLGFLREHAPEYSNNSSYLSNIELLISSTSSDKLFATFKI